MPVLICTVPHQNNLVRGTWAADTGRLGLSGEAPTVHTHQMRFFQVDSSLPKSGVYVFIFIFGPVCYAYLKKIVLVLNHVE
jgi:hypothetical protein